LATLDDDDWRAIRRFRQEAHILTVAESNPSLLRQVVQSLRDAMPVQDPSAPAADAAPPPVVVPLDASTRDQLVLSWANYRNCYLKGFSHGKASNQKAPGALFFSSAHCDGAGGQGVFPDDFGSSRGTESQATQLGFSFDSPYALCRG
jgi:hypothetical protein